MPSLRNGTTIKCRPIHVYCLPSQLIFDPRSLSPVLTNTCKFKIYNLLPNSGWHKKPEPSILKKSVGGSFSHLCLVFSYASNHSELINLGLGKAVHSHKSNIIQFNWIWSLHHLVVLIRDNNSQAPSIGLSTGWGFNLSNPTRLYPIPLNTTNRPCKIKVVIGVMTLFFN